MSAITILLSILVLLETIRLLILIGTVIKNKATHEQNNNLMRVYRKLEYWLDKQEDKP